MRILVIIPVHNEAAAIGSLLDEVKKENLEILVIDDGSVDHSGEIAGKKDVVLLFNEKKSGKGFSLKRGFDYAVKNGFDAVITMDGDGQHDPADLKEFLEQAKITPDSVISGNRMYNIENMPGVRYLTNRFMSSFISLLAKQHIPDTQCGYRYISCQVLKNINLQSNDFEIETEVLLKAAKRGVKLYSVPIKTIYRDEKSKINPLKDTLRFFRFILKETFSSK